MQRFKKPILLKYSFRYFLFNRIDPQLIIGILKTNKLLPQMKECLQNFRYRNSLSQVFDYHKDSELMSKLENNLKTA